MQKSCTFAWKKQKTMIRKGERVKFLNDATVGTVAKIEGSIAHVTVEEGFDIPVLLSDLIAIDVEAEPLTEGFVAPDSAEMRDALRVLQNRVPLGATDLLAGIEAARKSLTENTGSENTGSKNTGSANTSAEPGQTASDARKSVVYIGDGISSAKRIETADFKTCVEELKAAKIPVSACVVGVRSNLGILGALANQTGGAVVDLAQVEESLLIEANEETVARNAAEGITPDIPTYTGIRVAEAAGATVVWPRQETVEKPEGWTVYPSRMPPIRSDRETILVAKADAPFRNDAPNMGIGLRGDLADGRECEMLWRITPTPSFENNAYIAPVFELAAADEGLTMPITDRGMLQKLRVGYHQSLADRLSKASTALYTGSPEEAITIAQDVLRQEPKNKIASRLVRDGERMIKKREEISARQESLKQRRDERRRTVGVNGDRNGNDGSGEPQATPEEIAVSTDVAAHDAYVDSIVSSNNIVAQKVSSEVSATLNQANKLMATDPDGAIQSLKLTQAMIRDNASLDPDQRNQSLDKLGRALKQAHFERFLADYRRQRNDELIAVHEEKKATVAEWDNKTQKVVQILHRYSALMDAGEYLVAAQAADIATEEFPDNPVPKTAALHALTTAYITEYADLRQRRHRGTIEALMSAERSFIPFPDEPPLVYPDPEVWIALSQRRKERFSPVNLAESGEAEKRISKALERSTDMELDENMTFEDFFRLIKEKNPNANLTITLGTGAIEAGITSSSSVVKERQIFSGIKLRNILKQVLPENELTYCVRNEMLVITTKDEANKFLAPKVYPVADLVIDPAPMMGMGGGMMNGLGSGSNFGGNTIGGGMSGGGGWNSGGGGGWNIPSAMRSARAFDRIQTGKPATGFNNLIDSVPAKTAPKTTSGETTPVKTMAGTTTAGKTTADATGTVTTAPAPAVLPAVVLPAVEPTGFIDLRTLDRADPEKFWNDYFAGKPNDQAVRRAMLEMISLNSRESNEPMDAQIVAMVYAALRSGHGQSWMYEPLVLSLQRLDAPKTEIERAAMSAADFAGDIMDVLNLAMYLHSIGLKERALSLYMQVSETMPLSRQVYVQSLKVARELYAADPSAKNEKALRTVTLAIARQVWEGDAGRNIADEVRSVYLDLEATMRKAGRDGEADAYAASMKEAVRRDMIVEIEWAGDAGLDLAVTEPINTICWYFNPRTTAGGLLQDVVYPSLSNGGDRSGTGKITYVCPNGFNGQYELVVQKEWGAVTGDVFKATITTHTGTGSEKTVEHYFP
ncbi:MAG TPA: hypothetical protein DEB39_08460, partial [Planctomycetaceae bacterium]|nr:hypothetical protein [Planctomycetaceae bacterium]